MTFGPRTQISPRSPAGSAAPLARSTIFASMLGRVRPAAPTRTRAGSCGITWHARLVSVMGDEATQARRAGLLQRFFQRRPAGVHELDRREVELIDQRVLGEGEHDRWDEVEVGQLMALHVAEQLGQVEP